MYIYVFLSSETLDYAPNGGRACKNYRYTDTSRLNYRLKMTWLLKRAFKIITCLYSSTTEAQFANPLGCLGSAEQFLLTLSQISELTARLKLWAFKLDYENLERVSAHYYAFIHVSIQLSRIDYINILSELPEKSLNLYLNVCLGSVRTLDGPEDWDRRS